MSASTPRKQNLSGRVYWVTRGVQAVAPLLVRLSRIETLAARRGSVGSSPGVEVHRPIYICGIPRSGTTVSLEMLSQHPAAATHRYRDFAIPYLPCWAPRIGAALGLPRMEKPVERSHRDRIMITSESPECVEEMFWEHFFAGLHDETRSNILDGSTSNPAFESFYREHIRKLIAVRGGRRYLTKSNYCILRLQYLIRVFPEARFLLYIRNPIHHVASIVKQDRLFARLGRKSPRRAKMTQITGHHHFGLARTFAHLGDDEHVRRKRRLVAEGRPALAWALEWAAVYRHVGDVLSSDARVAKAAMIVRYEDLCDRPEQTIEEILDHAELDRAPFADTAAAYGDTLAAPTYYQPDFSPRDLEAIIDSTAGVARDFGYRDLHRQASALLAS